MGDSADESANGARDGENRGLTQLLEEHGPAVYDQIARRIPRRFRTLLTADDVMQQTFLDAFLHFRKFVPHSVGSFPAWLTTVAERNLINALRMLRAEKRGGEFRKVEPGSKDDSLVALYELVSVGTSTPSRRVARQEAGAAVRWALGTLPEDYQQVVGLVDLEGKSAKEVAVVLGRTPGAVYMMRLRAHDRLSEILGSASALISRG